MKKRKTVRILRSQSGMTLIEVLVSTGIVGIIFIALMTLVGKSGEMTSRFVGEVKTIEGVAETVGILNAVIPQTTRITSCLCRSNTSSRAACVWDSSSAWYDPVITGGATSGATILAGEFEAYDGTQALNSMAGLAKPTTYAGGPCIAQASTMATALQKGCRQAYELIYRAPTQATATPSNSGSLVLSMAGGARSYMIGNHVEGGAGGLGLTELACGFDSSGGGVTGANFVLNMRVKTKQNIVRVTSHPQYESWYPGRSAAAQSVLATKNYLRGQFREIRLKFGMRNISARGIYAWRALSIRNCKVNGVTATTTEQCCSQARTGTTCVACIASGVAGATSSCCSGRVTGGVCD